MFLSICIPTYNRAHLLAQALEAIANQLTEATAQQVEVIISDNASPDNTPETVINFCATHPAIHLAYTRQPENLGAEGNINYLIGRAQGDFMYLLSDDDILLPGAIDRLFEILSANPTIDAVLPNIRIFATTIDDAGAPLRSLDRDRLLIDPNETLLLLNTWLTFMSALVFRAPLVTNRDYASRIGTNFIHSYLFLDVLTRNGGCYAIRQPFLAIRGDNTGGYSFFKAFVSDFADLMKHANTIGYSKRVTKRVLKLHQRFLITFVIGFKVRGSFGTLKPDFRDGLQRILRVYANDPLFLGLMVPLLMTPSVLLHSIWRLRRTLRRRTGNGRYAAASETA